MENLINKTDEPTWQNRVPELTGIRTGPPDVETLVVLERKTRLAGGLSEQGEVETGKRQTAGMKGRMTQEH